MKTLVMLTFAALIANGPMLLVYAWRRFKNRPDVSTVKPLALGFEGPVLLSLLALTATWVPPFPWVVLVVPWLLHVGTWIALVRLARRLHGGHRE